MPSTEYDNQVSILQSHGENAFTCTNLYCNSMLLKQLRPFSLSNTSNGHYMTVKAFEISQKINSACLYYMCMVRTEKMP